MDKVSPKIPVDTGNLRQSFFIHSEFSPISGPFVQLGFSANYAIIVHEMINAKNWSRQGSGAKFLENALDRNILEILYAIGKEVQIR